MKTYKQEVFVIEREERIGDGKRQKEVYYRINKIWYWEGDNELLEVEYYALERYYQYLLKKGLQV